MKHWISSVILSLCAFSSSAILAGGLSSQSQCDPADLSSQQKAKIETMMKMAADDIKIYGLSQAIQHFHDRTSKFVSDDQYVFVVNENKTLLASVGNPENVGKNTLLLENTKEATKLAHHTAEQGGGWISYHWINKKTNALECKTALVSPLMAGENGKYYYGSAIFHSSH